MAVAPPPHATVTSVTTSAPGGSTFGSSVTFTATVLDIVSSTPATSGSVSFLDGATPLGTVAVNGAGQATFTINALSVGPHTITANYGGFGGTYLASSGTVGQTVNAAPPSTATFTVNKDFVPDSGAAVTISVSCTGGATVPGTLPAGEAAPAVFTVSNVPGGGTTCTATETVPAGYTANQVPCAAVVLAPSGAGSCTITNTLSATSGTFTVNKVFSPSSAASVQISLTCTAGTVAASPLPATQAAPAVFTVSGIGGGNTCTATETVPAGYTANQAPCAAQALAAGGTASCTITNTQSANPCNGLLNCQSSTNPGPGGTAVATSTGPGGPITATCQGTGTITVGRYASDPVGPTPFMAASFFDVKVASPNGCTTVTIVDCDLAGASAIQWWNPSANGGAGGWQSVSNQTFIPGPPACITVVINASTSPSVNQLTGTVFAGQIIATPNAIPPQIFQNPGALGAIMPSNPPRMPTPRPMAVASAASDPVSSAPPALRPPNTGDAGLLPAKRGLGAAVAQVTNFRRFCESGEVT